MRTRGRKELLRNAAALIADLRPRLGLLWAASVLPGAHQILAHTRPLAACCLSTVGRVIETEPRGGNRRARALYGRGSVACYRAAEGMKGLAFFQRSG